MPFLPFHPLSALLYNTMHCVAVPFCGLAVVEALSGLRSVVEDPYLAEGLALGYQALQPQQKEVVDAAAVLHHLPLSSSDDTALTAAEQSLLLDLEKRLVDGIADPQRRRTLKRKLLLEGIALN